MISYGVILLVTAVIAWAVGASLGNRIVLIVARALAAVGAILLCVGLILYLLAHGTDITSPAAMMLAVLR